jgi:hypothetical protein
MNSSLYNSDRATHLKIVVVAAITAAVVLIVGENARLDRTASAASAPFAAQPLLSSQPVWRPAPNRPPLTPAANPVSVPHSIA